MTSRPINPVSTTTTFLSARPESVLGTIAALKAVGIKLDEAQIQRLRDGYNDGQPFGHLYLWRADDEAPETAVSTLQSPTEHLMEFACQPSERRFAFLEFVGADTIAVTYASKFL